MIEQSYKKKNEQPTNNIPIWNITIWNYIFVIWTNIKLKFFKKNWERD